MRGRQAVLITACGLVLFCAQGYSGEDRVVKAQTGLEETLERQRDAIMMLPGVVGTGLSRCDEEPCIMVLANRPPPDLEQRLEQLLGGHRFTIVQTDPIRAYPADQ